MNVFRIFTTCIKFINFFSYFDDLMVSTYIFISKWNYAHVAWNPAIVISVILSHRLHCERRIWVCWIFFIKISCLCGAISWFLQIIHVLQYFPLLAYCYAYARSLSDLFYDVTTYPVMSYNVLCHLLMNGTMIDFLLKYRTATH